MNNVAIPAAISTYSLASVFASSAFQRMKDIPLRRSHATRILEFYQQILNALPCMRSIPGIYSLGEKKCRERHALVDAESAYCAGLSTSCNSMCQIYQLRNCKILIGEHHK
jgi:hypothetical protein